MIIDCGTCAVAGLACDDCVVSVLLGSPGESGSLSPAMSDSPENARPAVTAVADDHAEAIDVLAASGLIPPLRLVPRSQAS